MLLHVQLLTPFRTAPEAQEQIAEAERLLRRIEAAPKGKQWWEPMPVSKDETSESDTGFDAEEMPKGATEEGKAAIGTRRERFVSKDRDNEDNAHATTMKAVIGQTVARALLGPFISLVVILGGLFVTPNTAHGQVSQEALARYVAEALMETEGWIYKWTTPIRYSVAGDARSSHIEMLIRRAMNEIEGLTGVNVRELTGQSGEGPANVVLLFVQDIEGVLDEPFLRRTIGASMSDAVYRDYMRKSFQEGWQQFKNASDTSMVLSLTIINMNITHRHIEQLAYAVVFTSVVTAGLTDAIKPPILNRTHAPLMPIQYPVIDQIYLRSVYSSEVRHRMPIKEGARTIAVKMALELGWPVNVGRPLQ
jgi:hypothetical protein